MTNINEYNYQIPEHLIAQKPADRRSDSRLLVYYKGEDRIVESYTKNITDFIDSNYFLVFNNSKVLPGRLKVIKRENNRDGEILVTKIIDLFSIEVITDKAKKYKNGTEIILPDNSIATVFDIGDDLIKMVRSDKPIFTHDFFETYGKIPIPPYIRDGKSDETDNERYQTIYSKSYGSSAAPTAGLHFDENIFNNLKNKKIDYGFVTLNVGLGTFQPIYSENIEEHKIHEEEYTITEEDAQNINNAKKNGKKIVAVGTTSLRALESAYGDGVIKSGFNKTNLYIYPPYRLKFVDALFTNFHTPKSSLLILVSTIIGKDKLFDIYNYAIKKEYRFFSYGDAMLIL
ncbi:MAG TPA: tRNA preQ1(34) S-adenosylmethionine ribosyltransferase-isomerase QueA [Spirochaetota bacterium]|mgnify:CR=1 FL=1|nr:tRNA preQ1(34) S-adenosylmethionine ribosyltransferase-isomerase QueA [Spirochaetota bacterium]